MFFIGKKLDRERFLLPVFNTDTDRYEIEQDKLVLLQGTVRKELRIVVRGCEISDCIDTTICISIN